jgi:cobalt-precorrin-7 (C5)-methyltransferase
VAVNPRRIKIVGMGPGSPDFITPAARRAVEQSDLLIGAGHLLALFPDVQGERLAVGRDVEAALSAITSAGSNRQVAILVSGDPGLLSLGRLVLARFGRAACEVIPGVSSMQVAFARLGLEWSDARIVDVHGQVPAMSAAALAATDKVALLLGCARAGAWLEEVSAAVRTSHRFIACERLSSADETIRALDASELGGLAAARQTIVLAIRKELLQT